VKTDTASEYLLEKLKEQREMIKEAFVNQSMPYEEMMRLRGVIQGLDFAQAIIIDLAKQLEDDDE
jgi:hypothetical protein